MKKWIALLLIITTILSMTACSTSQPDPTEAPQVEVVPTEYLPYEGETLTVLCMSGAHADAALAMAPEFEAITGAKVVVVDYAYQELYEQARLEVVSYLGTYDVINMDSHWDGEFAPYLVPLDDYIARDNYDMGVWIENVLANCGQWQEKTIGIPTSCIPQVFAYRTDLMPNGIPGNWYEYRRILTNLNKPADGFYGIAVSKSPEQLLDNFNCVLWSMGGKWATQEWKVTVNGTEGRAALNHINSAKNLSDPECVEWTPEEAVQAFLEGKAAVCETWLLSDIIRKADDPSCSQIAGNWALGPIPHDRTNMTALDAWDITIPVGSHNKDLAWEWIRMYTDSRMQDRFYDEFAIFSPRNAFWEQEKMADLSVIRTALDSANNAWRIPAFLEAEDAICKTLSDFHASELYLDTAIRRMDAEMKTALENLPPEEGLMNLNY